MFLRKLNMTDPIYKPRCFEEFKRLVQVNHDNNAIMTLRWNDLNLVGKENLAHSIKKGSYSYTVRHHEKATIENIILSFNDINPILDQTRNHENRGDRANT